MDTESGTSDKTLAQWLTEQRTHLRISKAEAARRAGVGRMTWWEWEMGRRVPYDSNFGGIEGAMEWPRGSVQEIIAGGKPLNEPDQDDESDDDNRPVAPDLVPDGKGWTAEHQQLMDAIDNYARKNGAEETDAALIRALRANYEQQVTERNQRDQSG
jgi:hypothetical protein